MVMKHCGSAHICFGIEHDRGGSCQVKVIPVEVSQLLLRSAAERAHKDPLGGRPRYSLPGCIDTP